jgi:hypothetical protein
MKELNITGAIVHCIPLMDFEQYLFYNQKVYNIVVEVRQTLHLLKGICQ